jgi:hypothetical protein
MPPAIAIPRLNFFILRRPLRAVTRRP